MRRRRLNKQEGFTLLELIIAMGVMAILAGVVIVAINPAKQTSAARNIQRQSDLEKIQSALNEYAIAGNGSFPAGLNTSLQMIGTAASGCNVVCGPGTLTSIQNTFTDNNAITFSSGSFSNTQWDAPANAVDLTSLGLTARTGTYTSAIKDASANQTWTTISWIPNAPYNRPLPNNQANETGYPTGNASMLMNRLLMHMNELSGAIADTSGNNNNGAVNGSVVYGATGKLGTGLSWSGGTNRYVQVPNNATLNLANAGGSVSVWVRPTLALAANTGMGVVRKPDYGASLTTPGGYGIELYRTTGAGPHNVKVHLGWNNGTTNSQQTLTGTTNLVSGTWYHIVFAWNAATMTIYVNGVQDATAPRVNGQLNWASNTAALDIGRNTASVSSNRAWYSGIMDEVALFNRTLSPGEALDFYKRGALILRHQVRSCNDSLCVGETFVGPDGTAGTYYDDYASAALTPPSFNLTNIIPNRYFQYRSFFDTDTTAYGPALTSITVNNNGSGTIDTPTTATTAAACTNLAATLTPTYLPTVPTDPATGTLAKTFYAIQRLDTTITGNGFLLRACSPELGKAIEIKQ